MDNRTTALGAIVLTIVTASIAYEPSMPLREGGSAPSFTAAHGNVSVVWVIRPEDLLTCQDVTTALRRIERRFSDVSLHVVVLMVRHLERQGGYKGETPSSRECAGVRRVIDVPVM